MRKILCPKSGLWFNLGSIGMFVWGFWYFFFFFLTWTFSQCNSYYHTHSSAPSTSEGIPREIFSLPGFPIAFSSFNLFASCHYFPYLGYCSVSLHSSGYGVCFYYIQLPLYLYIIPLLSSYFHSTFFPDAFNFVPFPLLPNSFPQPGLKLETFCQVVASALSLIFSFETYLYYQYIDHNGSDQWGVRALERYVFICDLTNSHCGRCDKLTAIAETPEQLTNGNHPEETQEEEQNGGMLPHNGDTFVIVWSLTPVVRMKRPFPDLREASSRAL